MRASARLFPKVALIMFVSSSQPSGIRISRFVRSRSDRVAGLRVRPRAKEVQERRALVAALKLLVLGIGQENRYAVPWRVIICGPSCAALIKALSSALASCTCHTDFIGLRITESDHGGEQDVNDAVARPGDAGLRAEVSCEALAGPRSAERRLLTRGVCQAYGSLR
jgi:hypothetical protein